MGLIEVRDQLINGSAESRATARKELRARFLTRPDDVSKLSRDQITAAQRLWVIAAADQNDRDELVRAWMRERAGSLATLSDASKIWLVGELRPSIQPDTNVSALIDNVVEGFSIHQDESDSRDARTWSIAARALAPHLDAGQRESLLKEARSAFRRATVTKTAFGLRDTREYLDVVLWQQTFMALSDGEAAGSLAYAEELPALLSRITKTEMYWRFNYAYMELLAKPLARPDARAALAAHLVGEDGRVRQDVARVLGFAHLAAGDIKDWQSECLRRSRKSEEKDQTAQWLMALGYAEAIAVEGVQPELEFQRAHNALTLSDDATTWTEALDRVIFIHCAFHRHGQAQRELDRFSGYIDNPQQVQRWQRFIEDSRFVVAQENQAEF
ncbi:MAG: hypothetical protein AAGD32_16705 [Planctomycetota bacterium]